MGVRANFAAFLVAAGALLLSAPCATAQTAPGAEAYGRLPAVIDTAISPDGRRLALAGYDGQRSVVRIVNVETGATEHAAAAEGGTKLRGVAFADNDYALFYVSETIDPSRVAGGAFSFRGAPRLLEYWRVGVLDLATGRQRYLTVGDERFTGLHVGLTNFTAPIESDPGAGRMISWGQLGSPRLGVYRVPLGGGRGTAVVFGGANTVGIILDDAGNIGARVDSEERSNRWRLFYYENGLPRLLAEDVSDIGDPPTVSGFMQDGRLAIVDRFDDDDRSRFYAMHPATGEREVLVEHDRFDIGAAIADPWTHRIVGARWTEDLPSQRFFDAELEAVAERMRQRFADGYALVSSWSRDRSRYLVFAETSNDAGMYYLYETAGDRLRVVGRRYPELVGPAALGHRQAITYRARDGQSVPAYLTLPASGAQRGLPTILLVHGGPHARDTFAFDLWASFFASRGYAVLQPNYRGSTGYGHAWFDAGRGGWGDGVMQTDVEDAVDALVRSGIADRERVCIVGGSYGGYAALAGATLTPQRYSCAIAIAGVSDLPRMLEETARQTGGASMASDWWRLSIGDRRNDRERLRTISPANRAADVRAPILLMHGVHDTVVPISQSRLMAQRLQEAGKEHRFIELEGDDHWLSNAQTHTRMLREMESFLAQHLRPGRVDIDDSGAPPAQ